MWTYIRTYNVSDIYRAGDIKAPSGWGITGFRVPEPREHYLNTRDPGLVMIADSLGDFAGEPRLIVERIKRKTYTNEKTGEFRRLKPGEIYKMACEQIKFAQYQPLDGRDSAQCWDVYKLVIREV